MDIIQTESFRSIFCNRVIPHSVLFALNWANLVWFARISSTACHTEKNSIELAAGMRTPTRKMQLYSLLLQDFTKTRENIRETE